MHGANMKIEGKWRNDDVSLITSAHERGDNTWLTRAVG